MAYFVQLQSMFILSLISLTLYSGICEPQMVCVTKEFFRVHHSRSKMSFDLSQR